MVMTAPRFVKTVVMDFEDRVALGWRRPEEAGAIGGGVLVSVLVLRCPIKKVVKELATIIQGAMVICM